MELNREEDARFLVHHQVTEKKLLHLEKGVRKLGFQSGGNRILAGLLMASVMGMAVGLVFDGMVARTFSAIAVVLFLIFAAGVYSIFKAWFDAKKTIHLQYEAGKKDMNYDWEYRFLTNCYEVIGKNEAVQGLLFQPGPDPGIYRNAGLGRKGQCGPVFYGRGCGKGDCRGA